MSSNIELTRNCQFCNKEFIAKTTVTKYCGDSCAKRAYKARKKQEKIDASNRQTKKQISLPQEQLKQKEILTAKEVAILLNCSVRTVYYYIDKGIIDAVNLGQRMTRVRRSAIDNLFSPPKTNPEPYQFDISDCYTISQVIEKYGISSGALYNLIKRNRIAKTKKGKNVYVPKDKINAILG